MSDAYWIVLFIAAVGGMTALVVLRSLFGGWRISPWKQSVEVTVERWEEEFQHAQPLGVTPMNCGYAKAESDYRSWLDTESLPPEYPLHEAAAVPVVCFAVRHPQQGDLLIDSGLNGSFAQQPNGDLPGFMVNFQRKNHYRYVQHAGQGLGAQLHALSMDPRLVLMTHMHPDHTAGLTEVSPLSTILFGKRESSIFYRLINHRYTKNMAKMQTLDFSRARPLGPFSMVLDLFGDMSVLAISSRGHTIDHISYFINDSDSPTLIAGDLAISDEYLYNDYRISIDSGKRGMEQLLQNLKELKEFSRLFPHVKTLYCHDF